MSNLTDYRKISVSLIATVFNEETNILDLLESYKKQIVLAKEFIIVDAFSKDQTSFLIEDFASKNPDLKIKIFRKKSNRSQARNFAASKASGDYLAFTDAGCVLDQFWLEDLLREQAISQKTVVGGFFQGIPKSNLEEAIIPYFLQLNKNVDQNNFLPTTRSLLIEKKLWQTIGGLNEKLELSEDYHLMLRLQKAGVEMAFAKKAIVYWLPPKSFLSFLKKIGSFAKSDIEAGIIRPKVLSIFLRYLIFLIIFLNFNLVYFLSLLSLYILWSIYKNKHNCQNSWYYLPFLQIGSDLVIMLFSLMALKKFNSRTS